MLRHIVLIRLKSGSDANGLLQIMQGMSGEVPQVRSLTVAANEVESSGSWDMALLIDVDDAAALAAFQVDPYHMRVKEQVAPSILDMAKVDFTLTQ